MTGLLMAVLLIGTVLLVSICAPPVHAVPPVPTAAYFFEQASEPNIREDFTLVFPAISDTFLQDTEGGRGVQSDDLKDQARLWIVEKSVQILREHGKSDKEIRSIIMSDFCIDEGTLDKVLKS